MQPGFLYCISYFMSGFYKLLTANIKDNITGKLDVQMLSGVGVIAKMRYNIA